MKNNKYFDIKGNSIKIGDTITTTKGDRFGTPKTGTIYGFDMWSTLPRALINNCSHGKDKSTILVKNAIKVKSDND